MLLLSCYFLPLGHVTRNGVVLLTVTNESFCNRRRCRFPYCWCWSRIDIEPPSSPRVARYICRWRGKRPGGRVQRRGQFTHRYTRRAIVGTLEARELTVPSRYVLVSDAVRGWNGNFHTLTVLVDRTDGTDRVGRPETALQIISIFSMKPPCPRRDDGILLGFVWQLLPTDDMVIRAVRAETCQPASSLLMGSCMNIEIFKRILGKTLC